MNLRASTFFFVLFGCSAAVACGGATADEPSEPEVNIPTNVPKSSSSGGASSGARTDLSTSTASCSQDTVDGYGCTTPSAVGAAEALAYIEKLAAQPVSIAKGTALFLSSDFVADSDLELSASDLAPTNCADCQLPYFRTRGFPRFEAVPGVTCLEDAPQQPIVRIEAACARIAIAKGTRFRVRSVIQDMHPSAPTYWPFVDFLSPCTTSCKPGEIYASQSHQCFSSAYEKCTYGDGFTPAYCACRADECHAMAKGSECHYASSPDVEESGTCGQSGCVARH